ncbi:hypothetical protein FOZ61_002120 [Perkinsus olseni]|uniref:glutathione transferase n=1 Tax=Perkinsus olseni TaxID=32597 RepID=A0A7J6M9I5_PEROL|nr:hypothetical protein FOZ61_002120 [Perkinsus olseni]KAF4668243.1 hypothetical protein FOL46_002089 [Perkinsus olseni]
MEDPASSDSPVEYSLKYFPMRGRGEPVRLMLELNRLPYAEVDVNYQDMKGHAGMADSPFGQVPLLVHKGNTVAQMDGILRYLGRMNNMYCGSPAQLAAIDEMLSGLESMRLEYYNLAYIGQFSSEAVAAYERRHINPSSRSGDNKGAHMFFIYQLFLRNFADYESCLNIGHVQLFDVVDLHLRKTLDQSRNFDKWYPELVEFHRYFSRIPSINDYLKSDRRPMNVNVNHLG